MAYNRINHTHPIQKLAFKKKFHKDSLLVRQKKQRCLLLCHSHSKVVDDVMEEGYKCARRFWLERVLVVVAICGVLLPGCFVLEGSGSTATFVVTPQQGIFSLQLHDSFQVRIQSGSQDQFDFKLDNNLRAFVETKEEEPGEWTLRLLPGLQYKPKTLEVTVTAKFIQRLIANETASVVVTGFPSLERPINIRMNDSSSLRWSDRVDLNSTLNLEIKGEAQVVFSDLVVSQNAEALCRCQGGQLTLTGAGSSFTLLAKQQHKANLKGMVLQTMDVELAESSFAEVTVEKTLSISLFGRSSLVYSGNPEVTIKVKDRDASLTQKSGN